MDELLTRAKQLHRQGRVREAESLYRQALASAACDAEVHYLHGVACQALGENQAAVASLRTAVAAEPDHAGARHYLGVALAHAGQLAEAVEQLGLALRLSPQSQEIASNLRYAQAALEGEQGRDLGLQGEFAAAAGCFERSLEVLPDDADTLCNLGWVLAKQQKFNDAIARYKQCLKLQPSHVDACVNLAGSLLKLSRADDAEKFYRHALKLDSQCARAWNGLGVVMQQRQNLDEARRSFEKALALDDDNAEAHQ